MTIPSLSAQDNKSQLWASYYLGTFGHDRLFLEAGSHQCRKWLPDWDPLADAFTYARWRGWRVSGWEWKVSTLTQASCRVVSIHPRRTNHDHLKWYKLVGYNRVWAELSVPDRLYPGAELLIHRQFLKKIGKLQITGSSKGNHHCYHL